MRFELTGEIGECIERRRIHAGNSLSDKGDDNPGTGLPPPLRHFTLKPYAPCVRCPSVATATHFTV